MNHKTKGIVILAAGASSRLGRAKQLVPFHDKPLLQHVLDACTKTDALKLVVLGAYAEEIKREISPSETKILFNPLWKEGISSSIKAGLLELTSKHDDIAGILFLVSDQPFVSQDLIMNIMETFDNHKNRIIASGYGGIIGTPAMFPAVYFHELSELSGDKGAASIIKRHSEHVIVIPFEDGIKDIDTKEDLQILD